MHLSKDTLLPLEKVCEKLHISIATGQNWVRLNKLPVDSWIEKKPFFSYDRIYKLEQDLWNGSNGSLKSRRNKGFRSGTSLYQKYQTCKQAEQEIETTLFWYNQAIEGNTDSSFSHALLCACLLECALQLYEKKEQLIQEDAVGLLPSYLDSPKKFSLPDAFPYSLFEQKEELLHCTRQFPSPFSVCYHYRKDEDLLGLLYQSIQALQERKKTGAYYTPKTITDKIAKDLCTSVSATGTFLDPSCGTGSFLLSLAKYIPLSRLYGCDMDPISVAITRFNLSLATDCREDALLLSHITVSDFLLDSLPLSKYDCIVGNPPWGTAFSKKEQADLRKVYTCATNGCPESYVLFMERALSLLSSEGILCFLLPEAFLQAKKHVEIRKLVCRHCALLSLEYLGNAFYGVQCPSVVFTIKHLKIEHEDGLLSCDSAHIRAEDTFFTIQTKRNITWDNFSIRTDDTAYRLLQKIKNVPNHTTLWGQTDFALGIVTGNNKALLSDTYEEGMDPILSGKEILPFQILPAKKYTFFSKERFQQAAPLSLYRAPQKLIYRFIAKYPVVALDMDGYLTLNSCNVLIPHIPYLDIRYLLAVLNSSVIRFYYENTFHSLKVLRSHLEQLPIPIADKETQKKIASLVTNVETAPDEKTRNSLLSRLDTQIQALYGLTKEECKTLVGTTNSH